jgi:hypothetical protein
VYVLETYFISSGTNLAGGEVRSDTPFAPVNVGDYFQAKEIDALRSFYGDNEYFIKCGVYRVTYVYHQICWNYKKEGFIAHKVRLYLSEVPQHEREWIRPPGEPPITDLPRSLT